MAREVLRMFAMHRTTLTLLALTFSLGSSIARAEETGFGTDDTTNRVRAAVIRPAGEPAPAKALSHSQDIRKDFPDLHRIRTIKTGYASALTRDGQPVILEKRLFSNGWDVEDATSLWILTDVFRERAGIPGKTKLGDGTGSNLPTLTRSGKSVRFHTTARDGSTQNYLMTYGKSRIEFRRDPATARPTSTRRSAARRRAGTRTSRSR
jgi:hypothetical protein